MVYKYNDWDDHRNKAEELAGNWRKFSSFVWYGSHDLEDPDDWALVYYSNRDADLLTQSNAHHIEASFAHFFNCSSPYIKYEHHSHWGVGYVDGYAIKVHDKRGRITNAFRRWCEIQSALTDYPVLDEEHYSELEWDQSAKCIKDASWNFDIRDSAPDGWEYDALSELLNMFDHYYTGDEFYPEEDDLREVLIKLDLLEIE